VGNDVAVAVHNQRGAIIAYFERRQKTRDRVDLDIHPDNALNRVCGVKDR